MYRDEETKVSYTYLKEVVKHLDEPICLIGGWAVYFSVNRLFESEKGYPYLGSRDIDLGFNEIETVKKVIDKLEELGFKRVSFRFYKEIHTETMKELDEEEAKKTPLYYIFPMYVDLIVSKSFKSLKSRLGFMPIDEPLLSHVFNSHHKKEIQEFGRSITVPSPSLLLAMKICSIKGRDKEDKRIKDLCDITALSLYSGIGLETLKEQLDGLFNNEKLTAHLRVIDKADIDRTSNLLKIDAAIISELLNKLV